MVLNKLKNWTLRMLECVPVEPGGPSSWEEVTPSEGYTEVRFFQPNNEPLDPRELPRPPRYPYLDLPGKSEGTCDQEMKREGCCRCHNCMELLESIGECPICLEWLGGERGVAACDSCANITCTKCAAKLTQCPYCRHAPPRRNTAIERLINKLKFPCTNPRILAYRKGVERSGSKSEKMNVFHVFPGTGATCPMGRYCGWTGCQQELSRHLEQSHSVGALSGSSISIQIIGFRKKVSASFKNHRKYIVSLACFSTVFIIKVTLYQRKLRLVFAEIGSSSCVPRIEEQYGAWLEVKSPYRTMKGIMPVSSRPHKYRELEISCDSLMSPWKPDSEDSVQIDITIRPLS